MYIKITVSYFIIVTPYFVRYSSLPNLSTLTFNKILIYKSFIGQGKIQQQTQAFSNDQLFPITIQRWRNDTLFWF
ncbi:hypothetical protein BKP57_13940 [Virgibacillus sp. 6R]|uniref:Uncharacterized protein n=1 Tax=Virgibacillus pantothenticus TaxID=1473 RepID=A0A0L0QK59_VIRPA|nr:hypothetical protein BKP57_13940 [Virgibacillus sp. 6R]KNE18951.1 hypothetical protein AFK71_10250 [Virgibacillus pantothenticus]SIS81989.1 hypothetical protein SAMN05421787_10494 [Virgibacillus pantothenticus]